jgi:hypothetical protein
MVIGIGIIVLHVVHAKGFKLQKWLVLSVVCFRCYMGEGLLGFMVNHHRGFSL